jgi:hypothetical protein
MLINDPDTYGGWADVVASVFGSMVIPDDSPGLCGTILQEGYKELLVDPTSARVSKLFRLCEPVQDVPNFLLLTLISLTTMSQFNYPFLAYYPHPMPANHTCENILVPLRNDTLAALGEAFVYGLNVSFPGVPPFQCIGVPSYAPALVGMFASEPQYNWQRCTEIVMPIASSSNNEVVPPLKFDKDAYVNDCFSEFPDLNPAYPKFSYINDVLGGRNLKQYSRIIFTNGLYDPVSSQSLQGSVSNSILVLWAKMGHVEDLFAPNMLQDATVMQLRATVVATLLDWLNEE